MRDWLEKLNYLAVDDWLRRRELRNRLAHAFEHAAHRFSTHGAKAGFLASGTLQFDQRPARGPWMATSMPAPSSAPRRRCRTASAGLNGLRQMVLRWVASALSDAATRMRKLRGCAQMRALCKALDARRSDSVDGAVLKAA